MGGCTFSRPSAAEDNHGNRNHKFPVQKLPRNTSSRREEGVPLNSLKRNESIRSNSSRREEGFLLNSLKKQGSIRSNSSRREVGVWTKPKVDGHGDVLFKKKFSHSSRIQGHQADFEKEKVNFLITDYPGRGSVPKAVEGEQVAAGWPAWLSAAAGEAIHGLLPRRGDTFHKMEKIGQGTYSSVYKARDVLHNKFVALKRVRFDNQDKESINFMAREILILRRLDHPNIIKLEGLIASPRSCSLYLIFEYMEHDLVGLATRPGLKFTESQVKCYIQQLLRGLDYCHSHGVLHRDIKGSNLLIDNNGILKIADLGLATFFDPHRSVPLTSRVVTLWYRPPELLLGASHYGVAVDLWSTGCLLAELYTGNPILPGKTEVEQLHKIFKLCGSPSEDYWRKLKLPHSTPFKSAHSYRRCLHETFKDVPAPAMALINTLLSIDPAHRGTAAAALRSQLFTTKPLPCDPSSLPKYPPSKEIDTKMRDEGYKRQEKVLGKDQKAEAERRQHKESLESGAPNTRAESRMSLPKTRAKIRTESFNPYWEEPVSGTFIAPSRQTGATKDASNDTKRFSHSGPLVNGPPRAYSGKEFNVPSRPTLSTLSGLVGTRMPSEGHTDRPGTSQPEGLNQIGQFPQSAYDLESMRKLDRKRSTQRVADSYLIENGKASSREPAMIRGPKGNKIYVSGPLPGPPGNMEKMLKERDRQIQEFTRQARHAKVSFQLSQPPAASATVDTSQGGR